MAHGKKKKNCHETQPLEKKKVTAAIWGPLPSQEQHCTSAMTGSNNRA